MNIIERFGIGSGKGRSFMFNCNSWWLKPDFQKDVYSNFVYGMSMLIASHFSVLAMMLTEAIIVYGREDKRRNLKIVRSKEFRPNFPVAEQNVGRIWPQPKCSKVGKVHQPPAGRSGVRGLRCVLHCATLCYTASTPYYTMLNYATQGCKGVQQHFTSASPGSKVAETGE